MQSPCLTLPHPAVCSPEERHIQLFKGFMCMCVCVFTSVPLNSMLILLFLDINLNLEIYIQ